MLFIIAAPLPKCFPYRGSFATGFFVFPCNVLPRLFSGASFWLIRKALPATVMVPVRLAPLFSPTVYWTAPLPFDDAPDAMPIQGVRVSAVHGQSSPVLTLNCPEDPLDSTVVPEGEIVALQSLFVVPAPAALAAWASCFTVMVLPATCMVPVRDERDLFSITLYWTIPFPAPLAVKSLIQLALVFAVHGHPALVEPTLSVNGADDAPALGSASVPCHGTETLAGETEKVQVPV